MVAVALVALLSSAPQMEMRERTLEGKISAARSGKSSANAATAK